MKKVSKKSRLYKNQRNRIITTKKQLEKKAVRSFSKKIMTEARYHMKFDFVLRFCFYME